MRTQTALTAIAALALLSLAAGRASVSEAATEPAKTITVFYPESLRRTMESLMPAAEQQVGARIVGKVVRASEEIQLGSKEADVAVVTDPDLYLRRASPDQVSRYVLFASDAMVIAYHRGGRFEQQTSKGTMWFEALRAKGVRFGRPAPDQLLGVRAILVLELAARFYDAKDLVKQVLKPDQMMPSEDIPKKLEAGDLDVALLYRSLSVENHLPLLDLPTEINLSDPGRAGLYAEVSTEQDGVPVYGSPLLLGATALGGAKEPELAARFVEFLTSPEATKLIEAGGYVVPPGLPAFRERMIRRKAP